MHNLTTYLRISQAIRTNFTDYASWTFPNASTWDKFYFYHKVDHLYLTVPFEIGKESIESANVFARPKRNIDKNTKVTVSLFGIPIKTENEETKHLEFKRT